MERVVKIFGLPRTCTNLTQALIKKHCPSTKLLVSFPDWKHGKYSFQRRYPEGTKFVICTKHPYRWLSSLRLFENKLRASRKMEQHAMPAFIRKPTLLWDANNANGWTPLAAFNILMQSWFEIPEYILVKQEDLRDRQRETFENLLEQLELEPEVPVETIINRVSAQCQLMDMAYEQPEFGPDGVLTNEDRAYVDEVLGATRPDAPVHKLGYTLEAQALTELALR